METPALLSSLLLRLPALLLVWMLVCAEDGRPLRSQSWWATALLALLGVVTLLPPLEFVSDVNARGDANYQQQFIIALAALVGGLTGLSGILHRWANLLWGVLGIIGVVSSLWGALRVVALLRGFGVDTVLGPGLWLTCLLFTLVSGTALGYLLLKKRGSAA
ncbi:hypothetical protein HC928_18215 [bacterium]|nr:hypothetical protein [bacterium]